MPTASSNKRTTKNSQATPLQSLPNPTKSRKDPAFSANEPNPFFNPVFAEFSFLEEQKEEDFESATQGSDTQESLEENTFPNMSLSLNDVQKLLDNALNPLKATNAKLQQEIDSLKSGTSNNSQTPAQIKANIMREEKEAAEKRVKDRLEEHHIDLSGDEFISQNRERMKTTDLDEFDGSDVYGFAMSVQSVRAIFPSEVVASIMARNLKDMAKIWFQNLEHRQKELLLLDAEVFISAIKTEFEVDKSVAKQLARDRHWQPTKEPIMTYFYDKVKMTSNSFGNYMNQSDICHEI